MPTPLVPYRQDELRILQGDDNPGPYREHDRVYRYDYYNDLGEPDFDEAYARPILGGSQKRPYPRRCRTGRCASCTHPNSESRPLQLDLDIYVPCDERFRQLKRSDSIGYYPLKVIQESLNNQMVFIDDVPVFIDDMPTEFDSFEDIHRLYENADSPVLEEKRNATIHDATGFRTILPVGGNNDHLVKMPLPHVIRKDMLSNVSDDKFAWRTDEEFAREMLAGVNPVIISRLTEFPAKSGLDPSEYGDHTSKITEADIQPHLEGLTVENALRDNKLFIVDYHDRFIQFLHQINKMDSNFIYASRTLLLLKDDGTMKPLAIELSLPHDDGPRHGAISSVYTPAHAGVKRHIWQLAKAYACVNDNAWHQIVSHWLNTHVVMEPFVIATNRQLSVVHPVHKLLSPHYRHTMKINAQSRHMLLMAGGLLEKSVFPGKYALDVSSAVYRYWNFTEQALPIDLVKRGVAVPDAWSPCGVRLLIKDYPYAVDGLAIWWAIELWVEEYLDIYYPNDGELRRDKELQAWWKEVREVGHGDLKDQDWWPKMDTVQELARTCTTIIWIASALHAAINFGQYSYSGYIPNRPTMTRRPMPEPGSTHYAWLEEGGMQADKVFIGTITSKFDTTIALSYMHILSGHNSDEMYLGQREEPERWTSDARALDAFKRFGKRLQEIEQRIVKMNVKMDKEEKSFKNRTGPVDVPYMLLYPNTSNMGGKQGEGITAMGIPNSIST